MKTPERPDRKPDFYIPDHLISFWWEERIVETAYMDSIFYFNPENWTAYQKEGELFDFNPYLLEKYGAEMNRSYAEWLLEQELTP